MKCTTVLLASIDSHLFVYNMLMSSNLIVFDTGTGGKIYAAHLKDLFPNLKVVNVIDTKNTPYGSKSPEEIKRYTEEALTPYLNDPDNLILIACNTATAYSIDYLREKYPNITFIGTEPPLKSAATLPGARTILVLATPATLKSPRYLALKEAHAKNKTLLEPDCSSWAAAIDAGTFDEALLKTTLTPYLNQDVNAVVLGCTHYEKIRPHLTSLFPKATITSPLAPITNRVRMLLGADDQETLRPK